MITALLSKCQQAVIRWIRAIDQKQYAHAHFLSKEYEFLTSNMVESMNSCLRVFKKYCGPWSRKRGQRSSSFLINPTLREINDRINNATSTFNHRRDAGADTANN